MNKSMVLSDGSVFSDDEQLSVLRDGKTVIPGRVVATTTAPPDTTPDAFTFTDVTGATVSTLYTSNLITISGLSASTSASATVTGGEYQKNGGTWTAAGSFTVLNADTVKVRATSSATGSTTTNVTLTVGGVSDTYSITTTAAVILPITAPVLAITSGTGAPVTFTVQLNMDNTVEGDWLQFRVDDTLTPPKNSGSTPANQYSSPTQSFSKQLTEAEIVSGDIDLTGTGFVSWSGPGSIQAWVERDDGSLSPVSNDASTTVVVAGAVFAHTTSTDYKVAELSGKFTNGDRTVQGVAGTGATQGVRFDRDGATKCQFEITINSFVSQIWFGIEDGTTSFNAYNVRPGGTNSLGLAVKLVGGGTLIEAYRNSGSSESGLAAAGAVLATGNKLGLAIDRSGAAGTHSYKIYLSQASVSGGAAQTIVTKTGLTLTTFARGWVAVLSNDQVTMNPGNIAFFNDLSGSGYTTYG